MAILKHINMTHEISVEWGLSDAEELCTGLLQNILVRGNHTRMTLGRRTQFG